MSYSLAHSEDSPIPQTAVTFQVQRHIDLAAGRVSFPGHTTTKGVNSTTADRPVVIRSTSRRGVCARGAELATARAQAEGGGGGEQDSAAGWRSVCTATARALLTLTPSTRSVLPEADGIC